MKSPDVSNQILEHSYFEKPFERGIGLAGWYFKCHRDSFSYISNISETSMLRAAYLNVNK